MGDEWAPGGSGDERDHQSAAVRLLRSVAPWTAPNRVESDAATLQSQPPAERDESINGLGISAEAIFVFLFFLLAALSSSMNAGHEGDGSSDAGWFWVIPVLIGAWIVWTWIRQRVAKARLRRDGMRAHALVTHVHPSTRPGIVGHGLVYRYQTQAGSHRGHATLGRNVPSKKLGDHIPIFYDIAHQDVSLME